MAVLFQFFLKDSLSCFVKPKPKSVPLLSVYVTFCSSVVNFNPALCETCFIEQISQQHKLLTSNKNSWASTGCPSPLSPPHQRAILFACETIKAKFLKVALDPVITPHFSGDRQTDRQTRQAGLLHPHRSSCRLIALSPFQESFLCLSYCVKTMTLDP